VALGAARPALHQLRTAGGGSNIAAEAVVNAPADGHTLLLVSSVNASNATLYNKLNFNFIRDIAPVASMVRQPQIMLVNRLFRPRRCPEFIAYAKANPGKYQHGIGWQRDRPHLGGELFKNDGGASTMVHVPYRGGAPALTDLIGGQFRSCLSTD